MQTGVRDFCTKWPFDELAWWCITIFQSALPFYCASIHHYYISVPSTFAKWAYAPNLVKFLLAPVPHLMFQIDRIFTSCHVQSFHASNHYFYTLVEFRYCNILITKDLSMMYRILCDGRHKGATGISQCTRPVAPSAPTYPIGPWVRLIKQCRLCHH